MYLKKYNLKGKYSFVTGAGKGLGRACAIGLAEAGANLIILSRTEKDLKQVSQIAKRFKVKCKYYVCDVTKYSEIKSVINAQKRIDIVVNTPSMELKFNIRDTSGSPDPWPDKLQSGYKFNMETVYSIPSDGYDD